jgi:hypothetical protein
VRGRAFSETQLATLRDTPHCSLSTIITGVALTHPSFVKVALALSTEGATKIGIVGSTEG